MGNNSITLTEGDRTFLISRIFEIVDRFDLLHSLSEEKKFNIVADFSQDMFYNLLIRTNKEKINNLFVVS